MCFINRISEAVVTDYWRVEVTRFLISELGNSEQKRNTHDENETKTQMASPEFNHSNRRGLTYATMSPDDIIHKSEAFQNPLKLRWCVKVSSCGIFHYKMVASFDWNQNLPERNQRSLKLLINLGDKCASICLQCFYLLPSLMRYQIQVKQAASLSYTN